MATYGVDQQTYTPGQIFLPGFPVVKLPVTIASGQGALVKGTVLGKITASGKYGAYDNTNSDGTETAKLILAEDIDATSEDVVASAAYSGLCNTADLTGYDAAAKVDLEGSPIFFDTVL